MTDETNTYRNADGSVRVPLTNRHNGYATLCPVGHQRLAERGIRKLFMSTDGSRCYSYVSCYNAYVAGEMETLARVLVGAGKGQRVRYLDGDVTNLRLSNLYLERGGARGQKLRLSGDEL